MCKASDFDDPPQFLPAIALDQVADVFYVRDIFGQKITADDKLAEITTQLKTAIDEWV